MSWNNPVPLDLVLTSDSDSFKHFSPGQTGLPIGSHVGAFGVRRKHHWHEGVDIYCPSGTPVVSVEEGVVVAIKPFTGEIAQTPWWMDTWVVIIEGTSGVVAYGEIQPQETLRIGEGVQAGELLGRVMTVLKKDKGRPRSMLHLELHRSGTMECFPWVEKRPESLLDPTPFLVELAHTKTGADAILKNLSSVRK